MHMALFIFVHTVRRKSVYGALKMAINKTINKAIDRACPLSKWAYSIVNGHCAHNWYLIAYAVVHTRYCKEGFKFY